MSRSEVGSAIGVVSDAICVPTKAFSYDPFDKPIAAILRAAAADIRSRITKTTQDMIETGRALSRAKEHLDHGQFGYWVETQVGIPVRTAQAYMAAARLADDKGATIAHLPPTTVHRLASKSAPPDVVDEVIARAADGGIINDRTVAAMLAHARAEQHRASAEAKLTPSQKRHAARRDRENEVSAAVLQQEMERTEAEAKKLAITLREKLGADGIRSLVEAINKNEYVVWALRELAAA